MKVNRIRFLPIINDEVKEELKDNELEKISFFDNIFKRTHNKESSIVKSILKPSRAAILMILQIYIVIARYVLPILLLLGISFFIPFNSFSDMTMYGNAIGSIIGIFLVLKFDKMKMQHIVILMFFILIMSLAAYTFKVQYHIYSFSDLASSMLIHSFFYYILYWLIKDIFIDSNFLRFYFSKNLNSGYFIFKNRNKKLRFIKKVVLVFFVAVFTLFTLSFAYVGYGLSLKKQELLSELISKHHEKASKK